MYASLTVHTDVTLALGRDELLRFEGILQVCCYVKFYECAPNVFRRCCLSLGISPRKSRKEVGFPKGAFTSTHVP